MISATHHGSSLPDAHVPLADLAKQPWEKPELVVAGVGDATLTIGGLLCDAVGSANGLVSVGGLGGSLCV